MRAEEGREKVGLNFENGATRAGREAIPRMRWLPASGGGSGIASGSGSGSGSDRSIRVSGRPHEKAFLARIDDDH